MRECALSPLIRARVSRYIIIHRDNYAYKLYALWVHALFPSVIPREYVPFLSLNDDDDYDYDDR